MLQRQLIIRTGSAGPIIKLAANASLQRNLNPGWRTIAGYEAIHMIRKFQACCIGAGAEVGLLHRFILGLFAAAN
jgi:hypothetical protein